MYQCTNILMYSAKMAPRGPKMPPRWPPNCPKMARRWLQDGPKMAPRWPQGTKISCASQNVVPSFNPTPSAHFLPRHCPQRCLRLASKRSHRSSTCKRAMAHSQRERSSTYYFRAKTHWVGLTSLRQSPQTSCPHAS